jgi:hypothetical protein
MGRISVQAAKSKGRELQKWVCEKVAELTGLSHGPDEPISSRPMGQSGTDVRLDTVACTLFPFSVECKRCESWAVHQWIEQAKQNQMPDTDWLLVAKRNRKPPVVIIDAEVFFRLLKK